MAASTTLIVPPPEVRITVDKTAAFVAKNGREFETRILEGERHNPKFAFMNLHDPYHAYYEKRVQELIEGGPDAIALALQEAKAMETVSKASTPQLVEQEAKVPPKSPEPLEFLLEIPFVSALDLDVIKLTAQFTAKNGRQFTANLAQREHGNAQFDFLKPTHSLYHFFTLLVEQYSKIILPPKTILSKLESASELPFETLGRILERAEFVKYDMEQQQKAQQAADMERAALAQIDWHDFVLATTVEFTLADRAAGLPAPMDINSLKQASLAERIMLWTGAKAPAPEQIEEIEMEVEDNPPAPIVLAEPKPVLPVLNGSDSKSVLIRHDYVPKASYDTKPNEATQICDFCKQAIPVSQVQEHMKIELQDPRWREQRQRQLDKHRDTNVIDIGLDVSKNLESFARHRTDIFGGDDTVHRQVLDSTIQNKVIWDGFSDSVASVNRAALQAAKPQIAEEMAALTRTGDASIRPGGIGPKIQQASPQILPPSNYPPYMFPPGYSSGPPQGYPQPVPYPPPLMMPPSQQSQMIPGQPYGYPYMMPPAGYPMPPGQIPYGQIPYGQIPPGYYARPTPQTHIQAPPQSDPLSKRPKQ